MVVLSTATTAVDASADRGRSTHRLQSLVSYWRNVALQVALDDDPTPVDPIDVVS